MKGLVPPLVGLAWKLEIRDRQGRILSSQGEASRSYVRAFLDTLAAIIGFTNVTLVPDTLNVNRTIGAGGPFSSLGPNDNSLYGPVVGTGGGAVGISDYKLTTQIAHGLVAGTLDHELTVRQNLQTIGSTRQFEMRRLFVNQSGGVITISECGLYSQTSTFYFCYVRDLVAPPVAVPALATATLIYTFSITA